VPSTARLLLAALLAPGSALAVATPAELTYRRGVGAAGCPEEAAVRAAVAELVGMDPFQAGATRRIDVEIARVRTSLRGRIEVKDGGNELSMEREMRGSVDDCAELASALELAIAIAIDPFVAAAPPHPEPRQEPVPEPEPAPAPAPAPAPVRSPEPISRPDPEVSPESSVGLHASVGALGSVGTLPSAAPGFTLQGGVDKGDLSLSLEGRFDPPASAEIGGAGRADVSLLSASIVPCLHFRPLGACALAGIGRLRSEGEGLTTNTRATTTWAGAGGRLEAELALGASIGIRAHLDVVLALTHTRVLVGETPVWETAPVSGAAGIAVVGRIP
jgi:hypothetical protein